MVLPALAMARDEQRLLGTGFDGYLTKRISAREFSKRVRLFCEQPD